MDRSKGVYRKYIVTKTSGEPIDPGAYYFVLRIDTDESARRALRLYGNLIGGKFGDELLETLKQYDNK